MLIFDLMDYETFVPAEALDSSKDGIEPFKSRNGKTVIAYPAEWSKSFGSSIYEQRLSKHNEVISAGQWNTDDNVMEYNNSSVNPTPDSTVKKEIGLLLSELEGERL